MSEPFFTVFTSTRNAHQFIGSCIESLLSQDFKDWEWIFVDDASTDDTFDAAKVVIRNDPRAKLSRLDARRWQLGAFLYALPQMTGKVIVELDGDDWFANTHALSTIHATYVKYPGCEATVGSYFQTDGMGNSYFPYPVRPGERLFKRAWCGFAPRTWLRRLSLESIAREPEAYKDPRTGEPWHYAGDIAMFGSIACFAKELRFIKDRIYVINTINPNRDMYTAEEDQEYDGKRLLQYWIGKEALYYFNER